MAEMVLLIGGMVLALEGGDSLNRIMHLPGMTEFVVENRPAEVHVRLDSDWQWSPCRLLHRFDIADGYCECRFGTDAEGIYYYDFGDGRRMRYDMRRPDEVEVASISDVTILRFALWTAYSMLGLVRGRVPIHSSTVVCDSRAVLCLGESGTGKSTHTRLWIGNIPNTYLLNDDSPILALEGDEVVVYGSPWSGKTHCYKQERHPVAALLRLVQRPENSIERLGVLQAFAAVQPSCPPCLAKEERCMDMLVKFVSDIISRTAVYRMGCLPDDAAAHMSHDTIFATL